jgi:hypothetical protein
MFYLTEALNVFLCYVSVAYYDLRRLYQALSRDLPTEIETALQSACTGNAIFDRVIRLIFFLIRILSCPLDPSRLVGEKFVAAD